jgi:uncharacterized membrane protein YtjA (UPF0391 family)
MSKEIFHAVVANRHHHHAGDALIAAALGFGGLAGTAAGAAKIVFVVGIILFLVSLFTGRRRP